MPSDADRKYDLTPLPALLQAEGVIGVARLRTFPAFTGPIICTLVYSHDNVRVNAVDARIDALRCGIAAIRGSVTKTFPALKRFGPLAAWEHLRTAAFSAPLCSTDCKDGVSYRHSLLDWQGGMGATWENPDCSRNREQYDLAESYRKLVQSSGMLLEEGCRVRIRTGLLNGVIGRVAKLKREAGRVQVVAEKGIALDLPVEYIDFAPEISE